MIMLNKYSWQGLSWELCWALRLDEGDTDVWEQKFVPWCMIQTVMIPQWAIAIGIIQYPKRDVNKTIAKIREAMMKNLQAKISILPIVVWFFFPGISLLIDLE